MGETQIINPHANFFQKIFSRLDIASNLFENYLSDEIVKQIDLSTLELDRESFVDNKLELSHSDLLFRVNLKDGSKLLIYFLIEHKSYIDRWVLFQIWGYIVRICERERDIKKIERQKKREDNILNKRPENEGIETEYLTPVIPLVLYHGTKKWKFPEKLSQLFKPKKKFIRFIPDFDYELINLSGYDDNKIRGIVFLRVALLVMKHYFLDDLEEKLPDILSLLADMINKKSGLEFLELVLRYLSANKNYDKDWLEKNMEKAFTEKGEKIMNTIADIWIKEGKKEGLLEEAREMVIEALKVKFNNVSQAIASVIQAIKDREILRNIHREAILCQNISEFQNRLKVLSS